MREAIIIGVVVGAIFFAGSAILTALAIKNATDSVLWDYVLWGGVAGMICSLVTLALYILAQQYGGVFLGPGLLINLGICAIIAGLVWHFGSFKPAEVGAANPNDHVQAAQKNAGIYLECEFEPGAKKQLPANGHMFHIIAQRASVSTGGGFVDMSGKPGDPVTLSNSDPALMAWRCDVTNYEDKTLLNIDAQIQLFFFVPIPAQNGGYGIGPNADFQRAHPIRIGRLEPGKENSFSFWFYNTTEDHIKILLPTKATAMRLGDDTRTPVKITSPTVYFFDMMPDRKKS